MMYSVLWFVLIKKLPSFTKARSYYFKYCYNVLEDISEKLISPQACPHSTPSWFGFLVTCQGGLKRNSVVRYIESKGVQTRILFAGNLTRHPCFDEMREIGEGYRIAGDLKNTDIIMTNSFWVGVYPGMTEEMLGYMAKTIKEAIK